MFVWELCNLVIHPCKVYWHLVTKPKQLEERTSWWGGGGLLVDIAMTNWHVIFLGNWGYDGIWNLRMCWAEHDLTETSRCKGALQCSMSYNQDFEPPWRICLIQKMFGLNTKMARHWYFTRIFLKHMSDHVRPIFSILFWKGNHVPFIS